MTPRYLSTTQATDWPSSAERQTGLLERVLNRMLAFLPRANPTYEARLPRVKSWLIEFEDGRLPGREIGLDAEGFPVLHGPRGADYGFWLDTNMTYDDFTGHPISKELFEECWEKAEGGTAGTP